MFINKQFLAERLNLIQPSPTLAVTNKSAQLKAAGKNIISLGAGEPDFDTPNNIKNAGIEAIKNGITKYTAVDGTPELKQAICNKFLRENNLQYTPKQISVGSGAKQVIFNAFLATLNPGDEVIIPAPYWVSYPDIVALAEGVPVIITCSAENNFKLQPKDLENKISSKTKWLILNSPGNPTGAVYSMQELKDLLSIVIKYPDLHILSDDIYEHIVYDDLPFITAAQVEPKLFDRIFTINGVSKSYSMTGWRIGYGAGKIELIDAIAKIQSQSTSNPSSISQFAAVEALNGPQDFINSNMLLFQGRRNLVVKALNSIDGIECRIPEGAFYAFPSCQKLIGKKSPTGKIINNSIDFAEYLLDEALVAVVPGSAFGLENFFRISYATSENNLKEACKRILDACKLLT